MRPLRALLPSTHKGRTYVSCFIPKGGKPAPLQGDLHRRYWWHNQYGQLRFVGDPFHDMVLQM
ncbi:hypothetical protein KSZ_24290 [Dictyobacter formicarum]|uniref:Uncharacterized protein n=1 Tax=Dictyobacter formicarum TaxID=2778368 RepID=A0ABQ3VGD0_9CHLR|nr:hypothetical protein KSZ_24290 [Dictyobacter formicarum]